MVSNRRKAARRADKRLSVSTLSHVEVEDVPVSKVRLDNGTAVSAVWRDPHDLSPNRRTARTISGFRAYDGLQCLLANGTINREHAVAGERFRKEFELGMVGLSPSRDLSQAHAQLGVPAGPSEARLRHAEIYRETSRALGQHLLEIMLAIAILGETIQGYSERRSLNRRTTAGYVLAAFDYLRDYYDRLDKPEPSHQSSVCI